VGELAWQARFCTRTPVEVVMAVAHRLTAALNAPSEMSRDDLLWGAQPRHEAIRHVLEAADQPWREPHCGTEFVRADHTAGIRTRTFGAEVSNLATAVTVWGGPRGYDDARWQAEFTPHTPTALITAALDEVAEPLPATRRYGQVPAANLTQARIDTQRPRPTAATTRGQYTVRGALSIHPARAQADTGHVRRSL
jgi:hypothetical protein